MKPIIVKGVSVTKLIFHTKYLKKNQDLALRPIHDSYANEKCLFLLLKIGFHLQRQAEDKTIPFYFLTIQ